MENLWLQLLVFSGIFLLVSPFYFQHVFSKKKASKSYDYEKSLVVGILIVLILLFIFIKAGLKFMELFHGKIGG
jgi:surface polysaccharide O-acyltransferase-like enzyme